MSLSLMNKNNIHIQLKDRQLGMIINYLFNKLKINLLNLFYSLLKIQMKKIYILKWMKKIKIIWHLIFFLKGKEKLYSKILHK